MLKELKELELLLNDWDIFCSLLLLRILRELMMDVGVGRPQKFLGVEEKRGFLIDTSTAGSSHQPRQICDTKTPLLPTTIVIGNPPPI